MRLHHAIFAIAALGLFVLPCRAAKPAIEDVRRLYDLSPVSATNPVLVTVKDCGIEIPASEFRAFVKGDTPPGSEGKTLSAKEKRRELQKLLDDHFWVWAGYNGKADQTEDIAGLLKITQTEAMKALLIDQEADSKAKTYEEYLELKKELLQRIFDKIEIRVSSEAYEIFKTAARRVDEADMGKAKTAGTNQVEAETASVDGLSPQERNLPLATSKIDTVRVGDILQFYRQIPLENRPNLKDRKAAEEILQDMMSDELLVAEAQMRGLDKSDAVRQQVQSDRTGLVRQWALDQVTKKTTAAMNEPGIEAQLQQWYQAHLKTLYTIRENGKERVLGFQAEHDAVQGDYFSDLQERMRALELQKLRQGQKIRIDEKLLDKLTVNWLMPPKQLAASDAVWDADLREYVVKAGETNTSFVFTLTNTSSTELVIEDVHSMTEYVTVQTPALPWKLASGEHGQVRADVDLRNKTGVGYPPIVVQSSKGIKTLTLKITYPDKPATISNNAINDGDMKTNRAHGEKLK